MGSSLIHPCSRLSSATKFKLIIRSTGQGTPSNQDLKSEVIGLYKNLIYLSRDWPTDLRPQIKRAFVKNQDVEDPVEIRKLLDKGEYICKEIIATYSLKKYRAMKRRYYSEDQDKHLQELFDNYKP